MGMLKVERIGGLAGYGGAGSRLKSEGQMQFSTLSPADQKQVESMFKMRTKAGTSQVRDGFRYRISRGGGAAGDVIEVSEDKMPAALIACVKDRIE
jgi:hypothetical protein